MGVPTAVLRQREKMQAELGLNPDGSPIAAPASPPELSVVPPAAPEVPPATPPSAAPDTAQARIRELEHLLSTRDGQTSTAMREANEARQRAEVLASQVQALEESVAAMQAQVETAEARAAAKQAGDAIPPLDVEDLTEEERTKFGEDSIGFVRKLSKAQLAAVVKPLLDKVAALEKQVDRVRELDKLPILEKSVQAAETEAQRVREEEFFRKEVLAFFPDFEKIRETQAWRDYMLSDIPGRGIKNHHLLDQYRKVHNAQGIRSLIQGHYDAVGAKPTLSSLATPAGARTEGTPVEKPRMKASEYKQKLSAFVKKQLSRADWDAFKRQFEEAHADGRVDMDERI